MLKICCLKNPGVTGSKFIHSKWCDTIQSKRILQIGMVIYLHFQNQNKYSLEYLLRWPFCQINGTYNNICNEPWGKRNPFLSNRGEQSFLELSKRVWFCSKQQWLQLLPVFVFLDPLVRTENLWAQPWWLLNKYNSIGLCHWRGIEMLGRREVSRWISMDYYAVLGFLQNEYLATSHNTTTSLCCDFHIDL